MSEKIQHLYWQEGFPKQQRRKSKKTKVKAKEAFGAWPPAEAGHSRRFLIPRCDHWRQKFELEDGLHVLASAWLDKPQVLTPSKSEASAKTPDIGFYLDSRWAGGTLLVSPGFNPAFGGRPKPLRIVLYPWEDWGVPENTQVFRRSLRWLLMQANRGKRIEVGCMGGHGRTGTTLASLLVVQGLSHSKAVSRVSSRYCEEAIESRLQLDLIRSLAS